MNTKQRIGLAIGGGIIAVAAAVGVGAFAANLANGSNGPDGRSGYGQGMGGGGNGGQNGGRGGQQFDTTAMAKQLATKLGVDEAKMKTALDNAMKANQPSGGPSGSMPSGGPSGDPSGARPSGGMPSGGPGGGGNDSRRTERQQAMAKSIATELNLDEATVLAALQEVMSSMGQQGGQPGAGPTS